MKLNKNYIQTFIFVIVYLFGIYFWTQPLQERKLPYGEYDAMSHFEIADYMAHNDRSIFRLPPYIDIRYGSDNKFMPHILWYPPAFHSSLGVMEAIGGERAVSVFLTNTIMATFVIVSVYFVINSLFGFLPAILSALLLVFSPRDFMPYLWGQWPERFAYAFVPVILYCFYKYFTTFSKQDSKPAYLYLAALFSGANLLIHPLVFFHSAVGVAVLYIFLSLKQKKFVFSWKHASIAAVIFLALFFLFPYQTFNIFPQFTRGSGENSQSKSFDLPRLFQWSLNPQDYAGSVPPSYFSFSDMHGIWTLPFLLLGILFLAWRREEKDLFLLAWLVSLYLVLHRDLIGKATFLHRSLSASAHIFAPLTAIGAIYLMSFVKLPSNYNKYLKYAIIAIFVYFAFSVNMANASKMLTGDTYNPYTADGFFVSLNREEYSAANWILENTPSYYNISVIGIPSKENVLDMTSKKIRWLAAVSQHVNRFYDYLPNKEEIPKSRDWLVMLDYTMVLALQDKESISQMQQFEKNILANRTLIYNQGNIRVYELEAKNI